MAEVMLQWFVGGVGFGLGCGGVRAIETWWAQRQARRQMEQHMQHMQNVMNATQLRGIGVVGADLAGSGRGIGGVQ